MDVKATADALRHLAASMKSGLAEIDIDGRLSPEDVEALAAEFGETCIADVITTGGVTRTYKHACVKLGPRCLMVLNSFAVEA